MSDEARTNAVVELTLEDETFYLQALNDRDVVELDAWVRQRMMRTANEGLESVPEKMRDAYMDRAIKTASSASWISAAGAGMMGTLDGVVRLLYQAARRHTKDINEDKIRKVFLKKANIIEFNATFRRIQGIESKKASGDNTPPASQKPESESTSN